MFGLFSSKIDSAKLAKKIDKNSFDFSKRVMNGLDYPDTGKPSGRLSNEILADTMGFYVNLVFRYLNVKNRPGSYAEFAGDLFRDLTIELFDVPKPTKDDIAEAYNILTMNLPRYQTCSNPVALSEGGLQLPLVNSDLGQFFGVILGRLGISHFESKSMCTPGSGREYLLQNVYLTDNPVTVIALKTFALELMENVNPNKLINMKPY